MPLRLGPLELVLILLLFFVVFGAGKLPQVGEAIGKTIRSFRQAQSGETAEEVKTKPKRDATEA